MHASVYRKEWERRISFHLKSVIDRCFNAQVHHRTIINVIEISNIWDSTAAWSIWRVNVAFDHIPTPPLHTFYVLQNNFIFNTFKICLSFCLLTDGIHTHTQTRGAIWHVVHIYTNEMRLQRESCAREETLYNVHVHCTRSTKTPFAVRKKLPD